MMYCYFLQMIAIFPIRCDVWLFYRYGAKLIIDGEMNGGDLLIVWSILFDTRILFDNNI